MAYEQLFKVGSPAFYVTNLDTTQLDNLALQLKTQHTQAVIRRIRGKKSQTKNEFFNEVAAALQFPVYFGENWDAFNDCITDMGWLQGNAYLLLISDAPELLADASGSDFQHLIEILTTATQQWLKPNEFIPREFLPTPFQVVFQCATKDLASFSQRLTELKVKFDILG